MISDGRPHFRIAALAALLLLGAGSSFGMDMKIEGDRIIMTGPIYGLDVNKFTSLLSPEIKMVVVNNSSGGDYNASRGIAEWIRLKGLNTVALGYCQSSCGLIFMGGVNRYLANENSHVAFHGIYSYQSGQNTVIGGQLRRFFDEMSGGKLATS